VARTAWEESVAGIEAGFAAGDGGALRPLLREARAAALPEVPDPARRLLVLHGLERAERCVEAGEMEVARGEFRRAVERAGRGQPPVLTWRVAAQPPVAGPGATSASPPPGDGGEAG
jgi:hypothetical protein